MTFTVEDGTGIAAANALVTEAYADLYFTDRGVTAWTAADSADKEIAIIKATDYMNIRFRDRWKGFLSEDATTQPFPRTYFYDRQGYLVDFTTDGIPADILNACCEYANRARVSGDLYPDPVVSDTSGRAVKRTLKKIGPIETETEFESPETVKTLRSYPMADKLLSFWLKPTGGVYR